MERNKRYWKRHNLYWQKNNNYYNYIIFLFIGVIIADDRPQSSLDVGPRFICGTCTGSCFCSAYRHFSFQESWSRSGFHCPSWRLPEYLGREPGVCGYGWCCSHHGALLSFPHTIEWSSREASCHCPWYPSPFLPYDTDARPGQKRHSETKCAAPSITR